MERKELEAYLNEARGQIIIYSRLVGGLKSLAALYNTPLVRFCGAQSAHHCGALIVASQARPASSQSPRLD